LAGGAGAATIVDWKPGPTTPTMPEFNWTGAQLHDDIGAHGNGDGTLPPNTQTGGGLNMETPFIIPGVPGSSIDAVAGTTTFFDSTLHLTGFNAAAPAGVLFGTAVQPLGPGDFTLISTTGVLLLHGTVAASTITGNIGSQAGAVFSANDVNYDGGLIFNQLVASGGTLINNDFSFSFVNMTPPVAIAGGFLAPFTTDATGLYQADAVPEPTGLVLLGLAVVPLAGRRRVRRD